MKRILPIILFFVLLSTYSFAYKTIKTEHFYVHFPKDLNVKLAKEVARWAEGAYETLKKIYPYDVSPVHIQLYHKTDMVNGSALNIMFNKIDLFIQSPDYDSELYSDNWFKTVIIHELTHIFELDASRSYASVLRFIFGKPSIPFTTPNDTNPFWFHEGMAVFNETFYTHSGRLNSTEFNTLFRKSALFQNFPHISRLTGYETNPDYPYGNSVYVFGSGIFNEIYQTIGKKENFTGELSYIHGGRFYYFFNGGLNTLLSDRYQIEEPAYYTDLYDKYKENETARQKSILESLNQMPVTIPENILTLKDKNIVSLTMSPDGANLYMVVKSISSKAALMNYNILTRKLSKLTREVVFGERLTISEDGTKLYYNAYQQRNLKVYAIPYVYDLLRDKEYPLKSNLVRYRDIAPSPDGQNVIGISMDSQGLKHLDIYHVKSQEIERIQENFTGLYPTYIDNENIIYFQFDINSKKTEIIRMNLTSREKKGVFSTLGKIKNPYLKKNILYYSCDKNGIYNIYSYDLSSNKAKTLTNFETEGIYPVYHKGNLFFLFLFEKGYILGGLKTRDIPDNLENLYLVNNQRINSDPYDKKEIDTEPVNYNALSHLKPYWWLPIGQYYDNKWSVGLITSWQDPLNHHFFNLGFFTDPEKKVEDYYQYSALYSYFSDEGFLAMLSADRFIVTYKQAPLDPVGYTDYYQAESDHSWYFGYGLKTFEFSTIFAIGGVYNTWKGVDKAPTLLYPLYEGSFYGPSAMLIFSNQAFYQDSILPENGFYLKAFYHFYIHPKMQETGANLVMSVEIFNKSVISLTQNIRTLTGEQFPQQYYTLGGISTEYGVASLRGYSDGDVRGYHYYMGNLELTVPFIYMNGGWGNKPFFFRALYLNLFYDFAQANRTGFSQMTTDNFTVSMGAELGLSMFVSYILPVNFIVGIAYAQNTGETTYYWSFKIPFDTTSSSIMKNFNKKYSRNSQNGI